LLDRRIDRETWGHKDMTEIAEERSIAYFLSYSGVGLPLNLVNPISGAELSNRNTFIRAEYDGNSCLIYFEKIVYGEVEMAHDYKYDANGRLIWARIVMDDEETILCFDAEGNPIRD
jgi:hypothetical protein